MSSPSGAKRPLDTEATVAVVLALGVSVINLVVSLGLILLVVVLAAYAIVIMRAPSVPRVAFGGVLIFLLCLAYLAALMDSDVHSSGSVVGSLAVTAVICLPLVYMRLRTPKVKANPAPKPTAES